MRQKLPKPLRGAELSRVGPGGRKASKVEFRDYLAERRLAAPAVFLAESYAQSIEKFLSSHNLEPTEENIRWAVQERRHAAMALLPYAHCRMPMSVRVDQRSEVHHVHEMLGDMLRQVEQRRGLVVEHEEKEGSRDEE